MRKRALALFMVVAVAAPALAVPGAPAGQEGLAGPAEGESLADWTSRWLDGAVGLIATKQEREFYAGLQSTQERLQFIRMFWERRDPRVRGPRNEYFDEFAERLAWVEENFADSREPSWETAFGRIAVIFGPPDRTRRELGFPVGFSERPPILWSYDRNLPGIDGNEDLLFVFRAGKWRLVPPSGFGDSGVAEAARQLERESLLLEIPSDYEEAMRLGVAETLVNPVDYRRVIDSVRTSVRLPDSQIPFSWEARFGTADAAGVEVTIDLAWRTDALVFYLDEGLFRTDMTVDARLLRDGEPVATTSGRFEVEIPEGEMEARRQELVRRTLSLRAAPGEYEIEIVLLDRLLGYRTAYRSTVRVDG